MPHRDPQTGKFVASSDQGEIEQLHFQQQISVDAADLDGTAGSALPQEANFEGVPLYDAEELIDRNEYISLAAAAHRLVLVAPSTRTADGTARCTLEVSTSPAQKATFTATTNTNQVEDQAGAIADGVDQAQLQKDDTIDVMGRALDAATYGPFSDGATGVGGGGSVGVDEHEVSAPVEFDLSPRDELFINGAIEASNISDGGITAVLSGTHWWSVQED